MDRRSNILLVYMQCILLLSALPNILGEHRFLGCYVDASTRALPDFALSGSMTLAKCVTHCRSHGRRYIGLQYALQCFCGEDGVAFDRYGKVSDSECNMPCSGEASEICGARARNSIYDIWVGPCSNHECMNEATCVSVDGLAYECLCSDTHTGKFCEQKVQGHNESDSDPISATRDSSDAAIVKYFLQGSSGKDGRDGRDGRDGQAGQPGPRGEPGSACLGQQINEHKHNLTGKPGKDGLSGPIGRPGKVGPQGAIGLQGLVGPQGPQGADATTNPATSGAVYVRWGRTTCPTISELIYEGMAGGEYYTNKGGGSNYLCLPLTPEFDEYQSGTDDSHRGRVYSAEYETSGFPPFASKYQHEVPCSVCRAENRGSIVTIPAMMTCPSGWTKEYYGYLMTSRHSDNRQDFACVDRFPESVPGGNGNENGALLWPVEVRCSSSNGGNLPCSSYPDGRELSCVVCTK